ncbi:hypothetical protein LCGC14_2578070, partial [marine sediment metagenome]
MPINSGYCKNAEPWNTAYALYDGRVVPCCHWWASTKPTSFNICGTLKEGCNILDIWNGTVFNSIRHTVQQGDVLLQCRGCGLAGGIKDEYRCALTDHVSPDQKVGEQFDILVTLHNNSEWLTPFLTSLVNTLFDKGIRVYIADGSNDEVHAKVISICNKFRNNIPNINIFRTTAKGHPLSILETLVSVDLHEYVCVCDVDVVMLREHWDAFIRQQIDEGITMIASCPRFKTYAELHFLVARRSVMLESEFRHGPSMACYPNFDWDEDVQSINVDSGDGEHQMLTYLELKLGGKFLAFDKVADFAPYWGHLVFDKQGKEFLYHNYWSARTKDGCRHPVPDICFQAHYRHILSAGHNASRVAEYIQKVYPS